ncbi:MAG: hypothetical protein QXL43_04010 [Methanolinea sp.]
MNSSPMRPAAGTERALFRAVLAASLAIPWILATTAVALVPPGAPDFVEPLPTTGTAAVQEQPGSTTTQGGTPTVPLYAWTIVGFSMIVVAIAALYFIRRRETYVPRAKRLQK